MSKEFDVIIAGGGPAGATLGAILARHTSLKVGLFEQEIFPREHIGESLISMAIPVLSYSGALSAVLQSECYAGPKPGGIYAWDPGHEDPWCLIFDHEMYDQFGILNFAIHVNRSEFDKLLLDHAGNMGVEIYEGTGIVGIERIDGRTRVQTNDGREAYCRIFVDASGRVKSVTGARKNFLSDYRNIAIWNHFIGGKPAQDLPGDWNIFRAKKTRIAGLEEEDWSPIASIACDDGWFWYIPVPKMVEGRRMLTHSVGLVTDPNILSQSPDKRFTDMEIFLSKIKSIPILCDLMADAEPVSDKVLTATNYSMISETICDYDEGWVLLGDSAFFVDPLFSTGVGLAMIAASSVSFLIDATLNPSLPEQYKRDLWYDYQQRMRTAGLTFSISVDQWYHGIARKNPDSVYWKSRRGDIPTADLRHKTFIMLGNGATTSLAEYDYTGDKNRWIEALKHFSPDSSNQHFLKRFWETRAPGEPILTVKSPLGGLNASDPTQNTLMLLDPKGEELALDKVVTIRPNVEVRSSILLGQLGQSQVREMATEAYWLDPMHHDQQFDNIAPYYKCHRFHFVDHPDDVEVPFLDEIENGVQMFELLKNNDHTYDELKGIITPGQRSLMGRLYNAGMLLVG